MWGSVLFVHEYRHELCTARIMSKDWLKITENIAPTTAAETGTRYDTCTCQKSGVAESSGGVPPPSALLASTSIIPGGAREVSPPCHHATADSPPRQSWKHPPNTALRAPSHPTHRATPELLCVCVWKMHTLHAENVRTQRVFASAAGRMLFLVPASQFHLSHPCSFGSHGSSDIPWLPKISCAWNSFRSAIFSLVRSRSLL